MMKSLGEIEAIDTHLKLPDNWEQDPCSLWRSPSSPPYSEHNSRNNPFLSTHQRSNGDDVQSSPSTPSEFEFDPLATPDVRDTPPVSPKFRSSFSTQYWAAMTSSQNRCTHICDDSVSQIDRRRRSVIDAPSSHVMPNTSLSQHSRKQHSTPPSPSVRQLITEEMRRGNFDQSDLEFYSAPQTPLAALHSKPLTPKHRPFSVDYDPSADQLRSHAVVAPMKAQRKSKSAVLDWRNGELHPKLATTATNGLTTSKSQPHASFIDSTSSTAFMHTWDQSEEERKNTAAKKAGSSKSFRKWAFKDFLRRTVPSSKADAHYIAKTMEAPGSSRSMLSNPRSSPISPQASPLRSYIDSTSRPPALQGPRPLSHPPSPSHRPSSAAQARWSPAHRLWDTQSETSKSQYSSASAPRTAAPSPPRSPLSPHVAHYRLQKAQSQELGKKTFLPYRQSLLGCLGGSGAFSSDQLVW
ncbi:hypothetical protein L7F22_066128 [Adiantum nelumboides]|nr:hypothetical protein [Adiantum nelumboides]